MKLLLHVVDLPWGLGDTVFKDPAGDMDPGTKQSPAVAPAVGTSRLDEDKSLGRAERLYWSSVGTEGSEGPAGYWCSVVDGDKRLEPVPLDLLRERWLYWEKPRLSSVSHGPTNEEEEEGRGEEEE